MAITGRSLSLDLPRESRPSFEAFTRIGIATKGVVYTLVGGLALLAAIGAGGRITSGKGAVAWLSSLPFGRVALWVIALGLIGYAAWRFVCALCDTEGKGSNAKGLSARAAYAAIGVIYSSTALFAIHLAMGDGNAGSTSNRQAQTWAAKLLSMPLGILLVYAAGLAIIAAGALQVRKGWTLRFTKHLRELPDNHEWVHIAGRWGHIARGIVFAVAGVMVFKAALQHNPGKVRGIEGALDTIADQPWGEYMLALVAAGLACYGAWCFVESRYRRV